MSKPKVPHDLRPRFDTPQAWYDWMVAESKGGRLPASRPATPEELEAEGDECKERCCYLTPDGRQCLVGGLYAPADAARLQAAVGDAPVCPPGLLHDVGWAAVLPAWLTPTAGRQVQLLHDRMVIHGKDWDHAAFVRELNAEPVFAGVAKATPAFAEVA